MKIAKLLMLLTFGLVYCSCAEDEDPMPPCENLNPPAYTSLSIITGIDFFDENASPIGKWGFPNHHPGEVAVYPIPSLGVVSVSSQQKIARLWLVPANCKKDSVTVDIPILAQDLTYEISELEAKQIRDIATPDFNSNVNLNFEDVATGMYRLFYLMDGGVLYWHNLYIDPSVSNFPNFDFMENECD